MLGLVATFPDGGLCQEADNEDWILKGKFALFWILPDSCILISWPSDLPPGTRGLGILMKWTGLESRSECFKIYFERFIFAHQKVLITQSVENFIDRTYNNHTTVVLWEVKWMISGYCLFALLWGLKSGLQRKTLNMTESYCEANLELSESQGMVQCLHRRSTDTGHLSDIRLLSSSYKI